MANSKNYLAFDQKWFEKHQEKLLWLLNAPLIKYWFRWVLRIRGLSVRGTLKSTKLLLIILLLTADFSGREGNFIYLRQGITVLIGGSLEDFILLLSLFGG